MNARAGWRLWANRQVLSLGLEVAAVLAILVVGLAIRADGFMVLPRISDETLEVRLGLALLRGGEPPLVGYAPHIGALFTYLVAGILLLAGPTPEAGRLVVLGTGTLTILPTYLLARDLGSAGAGEHAVTRGRLVGLIAALLLAFSGPHIATSSRIAYSNSLTPLFLVTGLWLLNRALQRHSGLALIGSGAAFGLAVQTAVSALAVGPGVLAAIVLSTLPAYRQGGWRAVWPSPWLLALVAIAALLMVSNLLAYNLVAGPATVDTAGNRIGRYLGESPWELDAWIGRLLGLARAMAFAVANQTNEEPWPGEALLSSPVLLTLLLVALGLLSCARRRIWLPLLVTVSVLLVVSALNGRVEPIVPRVRHYAIVLPLGAALMAEGLVWLYEWASEWTTEHSWRRWLAPLGLGLAVLVLVTQSLLTFQGYVAERLSRPDKNNLAYLAVLDAVADSGPRNERIYLDDELLDVLTLSGGRMLSHLRFAFDVVGQDFETVDLEDERLPVNRPGVGSRRLILSAQMIPYAAARYRLVPLEGGPGEDAPVQVFRAFPRGSGDGGR